MALVQLPKSPGAWHYCPKIFGCQAPLAPMLTQAHMYVIKERKGQGRKNEWSKLGEIKNASFKHIFENVPNLTSTLEICYEIYSIWI